MSRAPSKPRIAIALGDPAGIGPEIVSKAVRDPRVLAACEPLVVGDPLAFALHHQALPSVELLSAPGLNKRIPLGKPSKEGGASAIEALRLALGLLTTRQASALVTAPVSKESFHRADLGFPGHTEWLAEQAKVKGVAMLMVAGVMRAILMTRHLPLKQVVGELTEELIQESARHAADFARHILHIARPRIVLCGVNPHAGDGGVIGDEEHQIFVPALKQLKRAGLPIKGPLAADSAFSAMARGRYDLALAAYHDQAMIALKVFDGDRLVNITLGLPYMRTSPGHGTAYDIAGKNRANPEPMIEAILLAARYSAP